MSAVEGNGRKVRRPPAGRQTPQPGSALWPDGGLQALSTPWWEGVAYPWVPPRDRFSAADQISSIVSPPPQRRDSGRTTKTNRRKFCQWGQKRFLGGRGGALIMARIMAVLTTLAALFLVVGASTKY